MTGAVHHLPPPFLRSPVARIVAIGVGVVAASVCSWIEVPMVPVPMTMQTFAVLLIGAVYGWWLGALTIVAWLALAALGFPLLAGGAGGLDRFAGPTAGYLFAFPIVAALVGWLTARGWSVRPVRAMAVMLLGHALCLALGASWLATAIGIERAVSAGVVPFLLGAVLKSALAAAALFAVARVGAIRAPATARGEPSN